MKTEDIEKVIENKYSLLLTSLILLAILSILTFESSTLHFFTESVLSTIVFIIMLKILKASRFLFIFFIIITFVALLSHYLALFVLQNRLLGTPAMIGYALLIGTLIVFMIRRIFSEKMVTSDTVKGGISVYILLGIWWEVLYSLLWLYYPDAFVFNIDHESARPDFLYFSYSTMTTLGYGDILPRTHIARVLSMIQVLTGQIYLAVFVARLVGLHNVVHRSKK